MRKLLSFALLAGLSAVATAASNYYVVIPSPGKFASLANRLALTLHPVTLPPGTVGMPYTAYDLNPSLQVTGDAQHDPSLAEWSVVSGSLPAGMWLSANGVIQGAPTQATAPDGQPIEVQVVYRTKSAVQVYRMVVALSVHLAAGTLPQGVVGVPFGGYDLRPLLTVTGASDFNPAEVVWTVAEGTLPPGLSLNANGTITGTPTAIYLGEVTVRAAYSGATGERKYELVTLNLSVTMASAVVPEGVVGLPYAGIDLSSYLTVSGDSAYNPSDVSWSVSAGALPAGLTLNAATGVVSGTPTAAGTTPVTFMAAYKGVAGTRSYQFITLNIGLSLAAATPPRALVGEAYSYNLQPLLTVSGDSAYNGSGVTWSIVSGSLPSGLTLTAGGLISGTPTAAASSNITARATYKNVNGEQTYALVSLNISVSLAAATVPAALVGTPYSGFDFKTKLTVTGDPSYSGSGVAWSIVSGALPAGLTLNTSTGVVSGTPTASGTATFTVRAGYLNKNGQQSYQVVTSTITVTLNSATLPMAAAGTAYSYDFKNLVSVTGDGSYTPSQVTWSLVSGSLPAGLTLNSSNGVVSGTPASATSSSFTLRASYKTRTGQRAYTLIASGLFSNMVNENSTLTLSAPAGTLFREVVFASYGAPTGTGPNYAQNVYCHAANSNSKVSAAFLNKQSASIAATNLVFGDPCPGTMKRLAVVLRAY